MISEDEVKKLARLARLEVDPDYFATLVGHLNSILEYVKKLDTVDTTGIEALSHITSSNNVFRNDVVAPLEALDAETAFGADATMVQGTLPIDALLKNAPDSSGRFIRVPLVIE